MGVRTVERAACYLNELVEGGLQALVEHVRLVVLFGSDLALYGEVVVDELVLVRLLGYSYYLVLGRRERLELAHVVLELRVLERLDVQLQEVRDRDDVAENVVRVYLQVQRLRRRLLVLHELDRVFFYLLVSPVLQRDLYLRTINLLQLMQLLGEDVPQLAAQAGDVRIQNSHLTITKYQSVHQLEYLN